MRILVTGGSGSVGSRLVPRLVVAGHHCRVLVRDNPGLEPPDGAEQVEGDLLEPASLAAALRNVDTIVHLAAVLRNADSEAIWRANLEGTGNLIAAARLHAPQARVIMASTSLVYPDDLRHPATEDDDVAPTAAYPASKVAAETALMASGLDCTVLRLGFVYGDGDQHLANAPRLFTLWGWHPAHALHLVHHRDVAAAITLALTGAMDGQVVNIVDEAPVTAYEVAALVGAPIEGVGLPLPNPWAGRLDGSLARARGFVPTVPTVHAAIRSGLV